MNGALPPKRYESSRSCFIALDMGLPLVDRFYLATDGAFVKLPRAADLVLGVGDHLLPLRNPADRAREREDAGEHRHRDAQRALHDAGIEIDVRIQLSTDAVFVFQR